MKGETMISKKSKPMAKKPFGQRLKLDLKNHWQMYLIALPVVAYFIIFNYAPMFGIAMAFEKYQIKKGILGSQLVGLVNFKRFFTSPFFWRLLKNTLLISFYGLLFSFPLPIIFALCLNEVRNRKFKKIVQTISYLPYFISVVVVVSILFDFSKANGLITNIASFFGWEGGAVISSSKWFRSLYIGSNLWQHMGYNSIIFISALAAIDPTLYEAARIDGANRWKQTLHVTLPGIAPTIIVLLILRLGQIMSVGYEKIILMYGPSTYETADVIASYVYRVGILDADYSYSTAVNLFNSLVNMIVLFSANFISRKVNETSIW